MATNTFVFHPPQLLDGIAGPSLQKQVLQGLTQQNPDVILIDFTHVRFMDSIGLGSLVGVLKIVQDLGKQLYLCSLGEQVRAMLRLTSMEPVFTVFADRRSFERSVICRQMTNPQRGVVHQAA